MNKNILKTTVGSGFTGLGVLSLGGAELCCGSVRCSYNDGREGRIGCLYV